MPPGMPVAVGVDRGDNAALLALQIIGINNPAIAAAVVEYREMRTNAVIADDKRASGRTQCLGGQNGHADAHQ